MDELSFRIQIAQRMHDNSNILRGEIFGTKDCKLHPLYNKEDANTMFAGYVGKKYNPGGTVILGFNPSGGGEKYKKRTNADDNLYPLLYDFKHSKDEDLEVTFEAINEAFGSIVKEWDIWKLIKNILDATFQEFSQITFMNVLPYRTRNNDDLRIQELSNSWEKIIQPTLEILRPTLMVCLGLNTGKVVNRFLTQDIKVFSLKRRRNDKGELTEEAKESLSKIRLHSEKSVCYQNQAVHKNHPSKVKLCSTIMKTREQAENDQAILSGIKTNLQDTIDGANAILPLIATLDNGDIEQVGIIWDEISRQTNENHSLLQTAYSSTDSTSGTVSLTSTALSGIFSQKTDFFSKNPDINNAWEPFTGYTKRPALKSKVIILLQMFHLDKSPTGKKSSLELFQIAHQAYEAPISNNIPVITSLVPMREAVESALDALLKLRPIQEPTGSSHSRKIESIGAQLKKDNISDRIIQEWANQWHDISDRDLSASKRYQMTRDEWGRKLNRATEFFYSFLTGLDSSKLAKR
jgi:hypothetical protein